MKFAFEHIGLPARDPAALKDWYARTLDAELVYENGQTPPAFFLRLPGGLLIEIYEGDFSLRETSDNALNGWRHLALRVDALESAREELTRRGLEFSEPVKPAGGGGAGPLLQRPRRQLAAFGGTSARLALFPR